MSGGSYDYLYAKLDDENGLGLFLQALPQLLEDLDALRKQLLDGEVTRWDRERKDHVPYRDAFHVATQVQKVEATFAPIAAEIVKLQARLMTYRDLLYAIEWWRSGDYGPDAAADAVVKFLATGKP